MTKQVPLSRRAKTQVPTNQKILKEAKSGKSKMGRNEKCKCGSGKKYKNCCRDYHLDIKKEDKLND